MMSFEGLPDTLADRSAEIERREIEWLKTAPEKVFLYLNVAKRNPATLGTRLTNGAMSRVNGDDVQITTWPGTRVSTHEYIGPKVRVGGIAGPWAFKRAVDCRIFGVRYVGWYYESAGDYCRLRKAKRQ